jgi:hypothetical protein
MRAKTGLDVAIISAQKSAGLEPLITAIARKLATGESFSAECRR